MVVFLLEYMNVHEKVSLQVKYRFVLNKQTVEDIVKFAL